MSELYVITDVNDPLISLVNDDPVRPDIPADQRVNEFKEIIVLKEEDKPAAVICVSYHPYIPTTPLELFNYERGNIAVFYTIWSYKPGAGKRLISKVKDFIKSRYPEVERFVTYSPLTDMARDFHLGNGAVTLQTNISSVNYEYK